MENNADTQKSKVAQTAEKFGKLRRVLFVVWNFAYIIAYSVFIVISMSRKNAEIVWLPYLLVGFTAAYLIVFVAMLAGGRNNKVVSASVKNYKSSFKLLKLAIKLINLLLTVSMVFNTVINDDGLFAIILAAVSVPYVILQIVLSVRKMVKRSRAAKTAEKRSRLRKDFVADIKKIVNEEGSSEQQPARADIPAAASCTEIAAAKDESTAAPATVSDAPEENVPAKKSFAQKANGRLQEIRDKAKTASENAKSVAQTGSKLVERVKQYNSDKKELECSSDKKKKRNTDKKQK